MKEWNLLKLLGLAFHCDKGLRIVEAVLEQHMYDLIASFTTDVVRFMDKMTAYGVVLSGGNALRFVDRRAVWTANDFDFYCPAAGFAAFCTYVESLDGVTQEHSLVPGLDEATSYGEGGYTERVRYKVQLAHLDIIRSATPCALYPLTFFHSTLVMNAISPTFITVAYPNHITERCAVASKYARSSFAAVAAVEKYESRGYQVLPHQSSLAKRMDHVQCKDKLRFFGDASCLSIRMSCSVDMRKARVGTKIGQREWSAGWVLGCNRCGDDLCEICRMSSPFTVLLHE